MSIKNLITSSCLRADSEHIEKCKGRNVITPPKKQSLWRQYFDKFKDPIIIVLLVVFALSVGISLYEILWMGKGLSMLLEPVGVLVALLLATGIAFIFEVKANNEFEILNKVKDDRPIIVYRSVVIAKNNALAAMFDDFTVSDIDEDDAEATTDQAEDAEADADWWVEVFNRKKRGATLYRLRDDLYKP